MTTIPSPTWACVCAHGVWNHPDEVCTGMATERLVLRHGLASVPVCHGCGVAIRRLRTRAAETAVA